MKISVKTSLGGYCITLERGAIKNLSSVCDLSKKALVVTDDGVPYEYARTVASQFQNSVIKVIPQGETSKSFDTYRELLQTLNENEFTRRDCVVAVGGGVVGDLSGFTASTYMRGISFYNIPTTLLSQVDSSIGGKTAIDFGGYKNTVGAFYQPEAVIIDPEVLRTLPLRHLNNGLCESIKMAATSDKELFELLENTNAYECIDTVIEKSLLIKRAVVQEDEKETGLRKVLNFGHTVAHAIESATSMQSYLHGECVGLGMLVFSSEAVKNRIKNVLEKYGLPVELTINHEDLLRPIRHDKKAKSNGVDIVFVKEIGTFEFKFVEFQELDKIIKDACII